MSDVLRTFAVRAPTILPPRRIDLSGVFTHPPRYRSTRYQRWTGYCEANLYAELQSDILGFLRGNESVKRSSDLGEPWSQIVDRFALHGQIVHRCLQAAREFATSRTTPRSTGSRSPRIS